MIDVDTAWVRRVESLDSSPVRSVQMVLAELPSYCKWYDVICAPPFSGLSNAAQVTYKTKSVDKA